MSQKIILIDLDGPLADFEGEFLRIWKERFPNEFFIPFEERKKFYIYEEYPESLIEKINSIQFEAGFTENLPPVPGGVEAVKEIVAAGHEVRICTAALYANKNCLTEKKLWLQKHLGDQIAKTAIISKDKTLVRGNYLIDDKPAITGLLTPEWEHIVFDQPFNRDIKDKKRMNIDWSNWKEVIGA